MLEEGLSSFQCHFAEVQNIFFSFQDAVAEEYCSYAARSYQASFLFSSAENSDYDGNYATYYEYPSDDDQSPHQYPYQGHQSPAYTSNGHQDCDSSKD